MGGGGVRIIGGMGILLSELVRRFGGRVAGDANVQIETVASLANAKLGALVYLQSSKHADALQHCAAAAVVVAEGDESFAATLPCWVVPSDPRYYFVQAAQLLHPPQKPQPGIHPSAHISDSATIGRDASIAAGVVVGADANIGDDVCLHAGVAVYDGVRVGTGTTIHANAVLYPQTVIGKNCILHAGCIVGADGFGYAQQGEDASARNTKFPQLGCVRIGDDVEVGANTTIDRGALDDTTIGSGVKIDNLVQVGHNVCIGDGTIICGKTGVAGSVVIGKNCMVGGGVGIAGHISLADGTLVAGGSMVTHSLTGGVHASVLPTMPAAQWRRFVGFLRQEFKKAKGNR